MNAPRYLPLRRGGGGRGEREDRSRLSTTRVATIRRWRKVCLLDRSAGLVPLAVLGGFGAPCARLGAWLCPWPSPTLCLASSKVAEPAELVLDFPQERARQTAQRANEPAVVDGAALVDPDLAFLPISGDAPGKRYPQEALPGQSSRARQDPCRTDVLPSLSRSVWITSTGRTFPGSLPRRGLRSAR